MRQFAVLSSLGNLIAVDIQPHLWPVLRRHDVLPLPKRVRSLGVARRPTFRFVASRTAMQVPNAAWMMDCGRNLPTTTKFDQHPVRQNSGCVWRISYERYH